MILLICHHTGYHDFAYPAIYEYIKEYLLLCLFAFRSKNKQGKIKVHDKQKNNVTQVLFRKIVLQDTEKCIDRPTYLENRISFETQTRPNQSA